MNFQTQKKILEPLLKNSKNSNCADCNASTPSWASLDFGVFVCSNCSGAHRALGPTITRVKSASLDLWQEDWIGNMLVGNQILNAYWQGDKSCYERKPKSSATNHEIERYVYEKYVKKRYVKDKSIPDPLTQYKRTGSINVEKKEEKYEEPKKEIQKKKEEVKEKPRVAVTPKIQPKKEQNLLDFGLEDKPEIHSQPNTSPPKVAVGDMISFDPPAPVNPQRGTTTVVTEHGTSFTTEHSKSDFMSFEEMMNSHKNPQPQPNIQNQNGTQLHHSVSSQQMNRGNLVAPPLMSTHSHPHHNMVYNQQYPNQYGNHHHYAQSPQPHPTMQYQYGQQNQYQSTQGHQHQQKQGQTHWF